MSSTTQTPTVQTTAPVRQDLGQRLAAVACSWKTGLVLFALAIIQQSLGHHNADNSWLMTVAERLLEGQQIYADIIETNPPASFLIYVPAAMAAGLLQLPVEFITSVLIFASALGTLYLSMRIAQSAGILETTNLPCTVNAGIFALILVPSICFAQREHVALILLTPILFLYAARAQNPSVSITHAIIAGLMAGAGVCIKPYFALVMALPFLILVWNQRSIRCVWSSENIAAAILALIYLASIYIFFPGFFVVLPSLLDNYIKVTNPLHLLLTDVYFLLSLTFLITLATLFAFGRLNGLAVMVAAGGTGFTIAALIQAKGWLNHYQPGLSLLVLALAIAVAPGLAAVAHGKNTNGEEAGWPILRYPAMFILAPAILLLPLLYGAPNQFAVQEEYPGLRQAVERHAPKQPKIMAISVGLDVAFPLVRQIKGRWVGQANILWLMGYARVLLDNGRGDPAKMRAYIDADANMFAANVRDKQPDIILVASGSHVEKIKQHPVIRSAMARYRKVSNASGVSVFIPR